MPAKVILTGKTFGKLTVIGEGKPYRTSGGRICVTWDCRCECEKIVTIRGSALPEYKSCGCSHDQWGIKHGALIGDAEPRVYRIWRSMKERCQNPKHVHYDNYGGRGITVCERWQDFAAFFEDMGNPPPKHSIERRNGDGHYCKENCHWATAKQQGRNKRSNRVLTVLGITGCMSELAEHFGISYDVVCQRINALGWDAERAFTTPVEKRVRAAKPTPPNQPPN